MAREHKLDCRICGAKAGEPCAKTCANAKAQEAVDAAYKGPESKPIAYLDKACSFPLRPDAIAISDNCNKMAISGVVGPNGNLWWRCPEHQGQWRPGVPGEVRLEVPVYRP